MVSVLLICSILLANTVTPSVAAEAPTEEKQIFVTSETGYMEIVTEKDMDGNATRYAISQYENDRLTQVVYVVIGLDELIVENYDADRLLSKETICVSNYVTKSVSQSNNIYSQVEQPLAKGAYYKVGSIKYYPLFDGSVSSKIVPVYAEYSYSDIESYTINAEATQTLAMVVSILMGAFGTYITLTAPVWQQIAVSIVAGWFGSVSGGAIGVAFSENVAVRSYHYHMKGYDTVSSVYTLPISGAAMRVLTQTSNSYDEWFYDGYTPSNWKNNSFGMVIWNELFPAYSANYPGVESYLN